MLVRDGERVYTLLKELQQSYQTMIGSKNKKT